MNKTSKQPVKRPAKQPVESPYDRAKHWSEKEWKKLWALQEKMQKQVDRLYGTTDCGDSIVDVSLRNRIYHLKGSPLPVVNFQLLSTDEEWLRNISMASGNVHSASETLETMIKIWEDQKRHDNGLKAISEGCDALCRKLWKVGCVLVQDSVRWPNPEKGYKWVGIDADSTGAQSLSDVTYRLEPSLGTDEKKLSGLKDYITATVAGIMAVSNSHGIGGVLLRLGYDYRFRVYAMIPEICLKGGA